MGGLRIAVVVAMGMAVVVGCSGPTGVPEPLESSIIDVLDERERDYEAGERYLLSLVVPPSVLARELQVSAVRVNDPNGDTTVGSDWVRPRIVQHDCAYVVSRELIPLVEVSFYEGPPEFPITPEDNKGYSVGLSLLDDADQRADVFEIEETAAWILAGCSTDDEELAPLVPELTEIPLIDIGHPGFALRYENSVGVGHLYQYAVGDRVVLQVGHNRPSDDLDLAAVEELLGHQLERLQAAGLDLRSGESTDAAPAGSSLDGADPDSVDDQDGRSGGGGAGASGACGAVVDSGLDQDRDGAIVVLYTDSDAYDRELQAIEIFLGSSIYVEDFRLVTAAGSEPTRFALQMQPGAQEESVRAIAQEMQILAGVAEVEFPADC